MDRNPAKTRFYYNTQNLFVPGMSLYAYYLEEPADASSKLSISSGKQCVSFNANYIS